MDNILLAVLNSSPVSHTVANTISRWNEINMMKQTCKKNTRKKLKWLAITLTLAQGYRQITPMSDVSICGMFFKVVRILALYTASKLSY